MAETFFKTFLHQFLGIVNLADAGNCEASQMGMYQKRLGSKSEMQPIPMFPSRFFHIPLKFRTERGILNVVDCPVEAFRSVNRHTGSSRTQV